jgi:hypothetical protein
MASMSTTDLDVERLHVLREGNGSLRIHLPTPYATTREFLASGFSAKPTGQVGRKGPATDLVGTYWAGVYLFSDSVVAILEKHDVTGWRAEPIDLSDDSTIGPLWFLVVTGRSGPIYGVAGARRRGVPVLGQYLDASEWDGSDIFLAANSGSILVTNNCAELLKRARLRNLRLEPAGLEAAPKPGLL